MKVKIKDGGIYRTVEIDSSEYGLYLAKGYVKVIDGEQPKVEPVKVKKPEPIVEKVEEPVVEEIVEPEPIVDEEPIVAPKPKKKKKV